MEKQDELLSNALAAALLATNMPDKASSEWVIWLQNNRNQSRRVSYRIPFVRVAGGVYYSREELTKFMDFENARKCGVIPRGIIEKKDSTIIFKVSEDVSISLTEKKAIALFEAMKGYFNEN